MSGPAAMPARRWRWPRWANGLLLVAPATLMLAICLLAPIGQFLFQAINNPEIPGTLPHVVAALQR